jgi:N-acetylglucosamine-6-phosphate deacetylase
MAGVRCAIGHTHALPEQVTRAADAGAELSSHLGNGAHAVLPRHPNYLWAQLADDRLTAGFIADGHHLPADTFKAMLRAKGIDRAHLVSDSTALGGMPPGRYRTPVGGEVELSPEGRLSSAGTPFLAGAARTLADGVATAAAMAGLPLASALRLATANPGRFAGARGTLRPGAAADLITFAWRPGDRTLDLRTVVARGTPVAGR